MSVLTYHSVDPKWNSTLAVAPERFSAHCAWLCRTRRVVDIADAVSGISRHGRLRGGAVAVTFDDGFEDLYHHAFPVLRRERMPATVFLVAETLTPEGHPVDWVDDPPPYPLTTLQLDQILEMQEAGVRFESHTHTHPDLTKMGDEECRRDLEASRLLLEELLGSSVHGLAYPFGYHDDRVCRLAEKAGYRYAVGSSQRREPVGRYAIPRAGIYRDDDLLALRIKSSPWYLGVRKTSAFRAVRAGVRTWRARG